MKRTWILASMTAVMLAACGGGGADTGTTGGAGTETGAGAGATTTDTATMAPGAAPMDTAMTGDTAAAGGMDTAATQ
jgi:multiple sugar transport system substrate-binding protein